MADREEAIEFFMRFVNADCEHIAIENPIGCMSTRYRKPNQIIQPWEYGHPYAKATCLWLKGIPKLVPKTTQKPKKLLSWAYDNMIGKDGKILAWNSQEIKVLRSKTFQGIAEAMAEQWGNYITNGEVPVGTQLSFW